MANTRVAPNGIYFYRDKPLTYELFFEGNICKMCGYETSAIEHKTEHFSNHMASTIVLMPRRELLNDPGNVFAGFVEHEVFLCVPCFVVHPAESIFHQVVENDVPAYAQVAHYHHAVFENLHFTVSPLVYPDATNMLPVVLEHNLFSISTYAKVREYIQKLDENVPLVIQPQAQLIYIQAMRKLGNDKDNYWQHVFNAGESGICPSYLKLKAFFKDTYNITAHSSKEELDAAEDKIHSL